METQNLLHERSAEVPEGLYIELMNKLKKDFDNAKKEVKIVVINRTIPKFIMATKIEIREIIIKASVDWPAREDTLIKINKMNYYELRKFCDSRKINIMKINPRWSNQETIINTHNINRELLTGRLFSPSVINL